MLSLRHELAQPLAAIANLASASQEILVTHGRQERASVARLQDLILLQVARAGELLRSFCDVGVLDRVVRRPEALARLVRDARLLAGPELHSHGILASVEAGDDLWALVDRVQVQQVIMNLIRNAVTAMARRPVRRLRLVVRPYGDDWVEIRVSDTGPGVPPAVAPRMFLPFVTTDPSRQGLGLFVCRTIVDSHGGVLWLDNHSPHGATFVVVLPRMRDGPHG